MIDRRNEKQMRERFDFISGEVLLSEERAILHAAVWAFADEFQDATFSQIVSTEPENLPFFCDCVRHYWATAADSESTPCSITHRAIRCPFSDEQIIALVERFDRAYGLWKPKGRNRRSA